MVDIQISMDHVEFDKQIILRPAHVSVNQWIDMWEMFLASIDNFEQFEEEVFQRGYEEGMADAERDMEVYSDS